MKEWILENTSIKEEDYDSIINLNTTKINGKTNAKSNITIIEHPLFQIAKFTLQPPTFTQRRKYKIKRIKDADKKFYYIYEKIKFQVLAETFKIMEETLFSLNRLEICFHINSTICILLKCKSYLITAMCTSPFRSDKLKYLHTFVLIKDNNGNEYILDGTTNLILDKNTYYSLYKPQVITIIEQEQLKEDLKLIKPLEDEEKLYRAEYLCFPKEVITSVKKLQK